MRREEEEERVEGRSAGFWKEEPREGEGGCWRRREEEERVEGRGLLERREEEERKCWVFF